MKFLKRGFERPQKRYGHCSVRCEILGGCHSIVSGVRRSVCSGSRSICRRHWRDNRLSGIGKESFVCYCRCYCTGRGIQCLPQDDQWRPGCQENHHADAWRMYCNDCIVNCLAGILWTLMDGYRQILLPCFQGGFKSPLNSWGCEADS